MDLKNGYIQHAALAQLHRWHLGYESHAHDMINQLDILDQQITLKSGLGEAKGHAAYVDRVKQIPTTGQNAHHVKSSSATIDSNSLMHASRQHFSQP